MLRLVLLFVIILVLCFRPVAAEERGFGLGVILGAPTGLSCKYWMRNNTAIDGAVAWSIGRHSRLYLHADYLLHRFDVFEVERDKMALYYGIGGRIKLEDNGRVGIRIPVGVDYIFVKAPLDIFLELAPVLDLVPSTSLSLNGGVGIRFFFQ